MLLMYHLELVSGCSGATTSQYCCPATRVGRSSEVAVNNAGETPGLTSICSSTEPGSPAESVSRNTETCGVPADIDRGRMALENNTVEAGVKDWACESP